MSLELTKAPWPEWVSGNLSSKRVKASHAAISQTEYAFARHRVNLHEDLVRELEKHRNLIAGIFGGPGHIGSGHERVRELTKLLDRARGKV